MVRYSEVKEGGSTVKTVLAQSERGAMHSYVPLQLESECLHVSRVALSSHLQRITRKKHNIYTAVRIHMCVKGPGAFRTPLTVEERKPVRCDKCQEKALYVAPLTEHQILYVGEAVLLSDGRHAYA